MLWLGGVGWREGLRETVLSEARVCSDDSGVSKLGPGMQTDGGAAESHQPLAARCPQAAAEIIQVQSRDAARGLRSAFSPRQF